MSRPLAILVTLLLAAAPAAAQGMVYGKAVIPGNQGPKEPAGVAFEQKLGAKVPMDLVFTDHLGHPARLGDLIGGKPTVLALGYYRCPKLCNQVQTGLLDALNDSRKADTNFVAGGPFNVVVVSIDPREPPTMAAAKRESYLQAYDRRAADVPGWWFLTPSHGQGTDVKAADRDIHTLAAAVGFQYTLHARDKTFEYDPERGGWFGQLDPSSPLGDLPRNYDYQHASGLVLLQPDGTVSSYLLGINYSAAEFRIGVVQASNGQVGTLFERYGSQFCYVYDDVKGHYTFTLRMVSVVFTPFMLFVVYWAYRTVRQARSEKPLAPPSPTV